MKKGCVIGASLLLLGFCSLGAQAITIEVTPTNPFEVFINGGKTSCALYASPGSNFDPCQYSDNNGLNDADVFDILKGLNLAYKDEEKGESGGLQGSYNSTFGEDPDDITITHVAGTDPIGCKFDLGCWLVMKGGETSPARYLFNLSLIGFSGWNGTDSLVLKNFFSDKDISHAALLTGSAVPAIPAVPVPAAIWLFGTALLGFIGLSRSTRE